MIYQSTVIGAHSTHQITLSTPDSLEYIELKVESGGVTRRFMVNPNNSMEPKKVAYTDTKGVGRTKNLYRRWMYLVLGDTSKPESIGTYTSERDVVVNGILGFRRQAKKNYDKDEYKRFIAEQPSRQSFVEKLRYYQRAVLDTWQQEVKEGEEEMKALAKGEVLHLGSHGSPMVNCVQIKLGNKVRGIGR